MGSGLYFLKCFNPTIGVVALPSFALSVSLSHVRLRVKYFYCSYLIR